MRRTLILLAALLASAAPVAAASAPVVAQHDIEIVMEPLDHSLKGLDRMTFAEAAKAGSLEFALHAGLRVLRAFSGEAEFEVRELPAPPGEVGRKILVAVPEGRAIRELTLEYEGKIHDPVQKSAAMGFVRGDDTSGIISAEGVFLHGGTLWYPRGGEGLARFSIRADLPDPWRDVTEGDLVRRDVQGGRCVTQWRSDQPLDGPSFVANRFQVRGKEFGRVRVSAYFLPSESGLINDYVDAAGKYIEFYEALLGPYPFSRFDVVENFFTTGYGMPGFTLLGPQVVQMAHFGSKTLGPHSLGHEIVHCWWGNHVYTPPDGGNWCEALTSYCTNYYWVEKFEKPAEARDYRRKAFLKFGIFVDDKNDYPVRKFRTKTKEVDDFVGYTKGSMVFHAVRRWIGDDAFFSGLRAVRKDFGGKVAKWDDFQAAFEKASGRGLDWLFRQWLDRKGAPMLSLRDVSVARDGAEWVVRARVDQGGGALRLLVPVLLTTDKGEVRDAFDVDPVRDLVELRTRDKPLALEADPDFDCFRRFPPDEIAPCLELTLSHSSALVVWPTHGTPDENRFYEGIAKRYGQSSRRLPSKPDTDVSDEDLAGRSLLVLGGPAVNAAARRLAERLGTGPVEIGSEHFAVNGKRYDAESHSALLSIANPWNPRRHATVYVSLGPDGVQRAGLMAHYGWESFLVFDARKPREVLARGDFAPLRNACRVELVQGAAPASDPALGPGENFAVRSRDGLRLDFDRLVEDLSKFDVVFVGESHNDWATHRAEAGILKGLTARGRSDVAVSMEMFERDVQAVLDDYLAGKVSEVEFLMKSRPWPNYRVGYRDLVEHARARGLPVIAANVPRRLASLVARAGDRGLEAVPEADRRFAARELKAPEGPYRDKFLRVMVGGSGPANPMAQAFYVAQCLKDDTMAESIADFLKKPGNAGSIVVHYNGSFHSDGRLGTAEKVLGLSPGLKVAVVKIVSDRDLLSADPDAWRAEADYVLVCRKRGEDHTDGFYSFQVSRRLRFQCYWPAGFDARKDVPVVVAFHPAGSAPQEILPALAEWGFGDALLVLPEGPVPVWNGDGTPGYDWFRPGSNEDGEILAAFGAELAGFLENAGAARPGAVRFLGFGDGAVAAAVSAGFFRAGIGVRLFAVDASPTSVLGALEGPAEATFLNPRGRLPPPQALEGRKVRATAVEADVGPSFFSDAAGQALARAMGLAPAPEIELDRGRTLVLSLSSDTLHARRWAYKIQKDLERALKARVFLHPGPGSRGDLADLFLALHLRGVRKILHQPLAFRDADAAKATLPDWAREEIEGKVENLPPLTWKETLVPDTFPPKARGPGAPAMQFVILVGSRDPAEAADVLAACVKEAGLSDVKVEKEMFGAASLRNALRPKAAAGMPGMTGGPSRVYVLRPDFAASEPAAYLPALYRHGDEDLQIRAGFGCLNLAKVIEKRLEGRK